MKTRWGHGRRLWAMGLLSCGLACAQTGWTWPSLELGVSGEFRKASRDPNLDPPASISTGNGTLVLGEIVWNGTSSTPGSSCLKWLEPFTGHERWRLRLKTEREFSNSGTGPVKETSYPNAHVEAVTEHLVVFRCEIGRWDGQRKLEQASVTIAVGCEDGREVWRSTPLPLDNSRQPIYGLADDSDLYEFYRQQNSDQIAVLKRSLENGRQSWQQHIHSGLDRNSSNILSARTDSRELEIRCGVPGLAGGKKFRLDAATGQAL